MPNRTRLLKQYEDVSDERDRLARTAAEYLLFGDTERALATAKEYARATQRLSEISDKITKARQEGTF